MASSGRVRVVARIRGHSNEEVGTLPVSKPWILVSRPDENGDSNSYRRVKISFHSDQTTSGKQSYEVDECYEQDVGNEEIFSREIKPLISGLFGGQNITVFAYGPRGSGKTYTIQGHEKELGLAVLTMNSILPRAVEEDKAVTISVFEMYQDKIIDLLHSKRQEVSVFEDAHGKIIPKGLSEVTVSTTEEFQKLYSNVVNMHKQMQQIGEPPHQSHIGCILNVVSPETENSSVRLVGKINFVDLASPEDSRRKSSDSSNLTEITRIKKSLNAVHNVLYALNAKEKRVPFRESKLTRMLQDSLGGTSSTVMLSCMNPSFCQETVQTLSLASRSCIASFLACLDLGKSGKSVKKTIGMSSPQATKSASKSSLRTNMMSPKVTNPVSCSASGRKQAGLQDGSQLKMSIRKASGGVVVEAKGRKLFTETNQTKNMMSPKVMKPTSYSASGRKQAGSQLKMSIRKASGGVAVEAKGRKLVVESNQRKKSELENVCPVTASAMESSAQMEENISLESEVTVESSNQQEEKSAATASSDMDSSELPSENEKPISDSNVISSELPREEAVEVDDNNVTTTPMYQTPATQSFLIKDKENKLHGGPSPPLSARLRELSNNLKSLCISTEANLKMTKETSTLFDIHENMEPRTPNFQQDGKGHDKYDITSTASPWEAFNMRSSGMKNSFVQEYLKFLNTASKEELKKLKGIGEKRATYILERREESPEPFKELDDLQDIGLSAKQIKGFMKDVSGNLFT